MLLVAVLGAFLGTLRRHVAGLDHKVQAVLQRLSEGGVEVVEQVSTQVNVPEPWRDLDGIADEDIDEPHLPRRVNRDTWIDQ